MAAIRKSRWFDPYEKNSKGRAVPTIKDCWTCAQAGVYLIRHKQTGAIVYVGSSTTQLKKTIYRHFEQWTDRQKSGRKFERVTYPKTGYYEIRFIKCDAATALKLEKGLILKYQPKDNPMKYTSLTIPEQKAATQLADKINDWDTIPKADYYEPAPF